MKVKRKELTLHSVRILILCGALALASCTTKQSAIDQLEAFTYELRDNSRNYDVNDWQEAGEKFVKIRAKSHKHEFDYTAEEKVRIGQLEGQCATYMVQGAQEGFLDKLMNFGGELKGILDGILGGE